MNLFSCGEHLVLLSLTQSKTAEDLILPRWSPRQPSQGLGWAGRSRQQRFAELSCAACAPGRCLPLAGGSAGQSWQEGAVMG